MDIHTDYRHILVSQDDGVWTVTINRPEVLNAFNERMLHEMIDVVETAEQNGDVRCLVITGAGRAFGSGQDLSAFVGPQVPQDASELKEHLQHYHRLVSLLRNLPKPVIASINGAAAGISLNIALACDLRIAADNARFTEAFARIGLVPDGGGAYFLPRLVGLARAMEMVLLAEDMNAAEALRVGLINKCVPQADLAKETHALAARLAAGPTRSYGYIKELLYKSLDQDLAGVFALEGDMQTAALKTKDHQEGVTAFLQKRPPKYSGQ